MSTKKRRQPKGTIKEVLDDNVFRQVKLQIKQAAEEIIKDSYGNTKPYTRKKRL